MDTFKEKQQLDDLYARGTAPWEVWKEREPEDGGPRDGAASRRAA